MLCKVTSCCVSALLLVGCGRGGFQIIGVEAQQTNETHNVATPICESLAAPPTTDQSHYDLPANTDLPAGVTFATDWSTFTSAGGFQWAQVIDTCRAHRDPTITTSHGLPAVRFEVRPKDDPLALSDNTERAEIAQMQDTNGPIDETTSSGIQFYAISYLFPTNWAGTQYPYSVFETPGSSWPNGVSADCNSDSEACSSWSIVMQFYGWASLSAAAHAVGGVQQYTLVVNGQTFAFADGGSITLGKWTDFVIKIDWGSGAFTLYRRDEGASGFAVVASGSPGAPASTMFKHGLYRGGTVNGRTDILWVGPVARGLTFAAVENEAFATNDGP